MKKIYFFSTCLFALTTVSAYGMFAQMERNMRQMSMHMDSVFEDMSRARQAHSVRSDSYAILVEELDDALELSIKVPQDISAEDVLVEIDNGVLEVAIDSDEAVELRIADDYLSIAREHCTQSSVSRSVSSQMLPVTVDLSSMPTADLTDGVLTLKIAKRGPRKIQITTRALQSKVDEDNNSDVESTEIHGDEVETDLENLK